MLKKVLMLVIPLLLILGFSFSTANAETNNEKDVEITITNDETGETKVLESKDLNNNLNTFNTNNPNEKGYEVFIPIKEDDTSNDITPFVEDGSSKNESGVTANLFIDYNKNSNGKIRVNKVRGNWSPSSNMYSITNRKVTAHNGGLPGMGLKKLSKAPTTNSFSYNTGWGYHNATDGPDGPMAESTAQIKVSGMSGSHTINLRVYTEY